MKATVLTIGNELLSGRTVDTNFAFLARSLTAIGVRVVRHVTVGDERAAMLEAMRRALAETELVVVSGGLGPTADDLTREVLAELAQVELAEDRTVLERLADVYSRRGRPFTATARRQALLPDGVRRLPNRLGLAPGLWLEREGGILCAMPGVPGELEAMTRESLLPELKARAGSAAAPPSVTLRTLGIPESAIEQRIVDDGVDLRGVELAYLPHTGGVDLRLVGSIPGVDAAAAAVDRVAQALTLRFEQAIYARGEETIEEVVNGLLRARSLKVALAESCTGGLVGYRLTRVPGSSEIFLGGVVAYANAVKAAELGVGEDVLAAHGAVSAEAAKAMAEGACERFGADIGLGVTGIAGPDGGNALKPVGLVFIGLTRRGVGSRSQRLVLGGDRHQIREHAAVRALDSLRRFILGTLE